MYVTSLTLTIKKWQERVTTYVFFYLRDHNQHIYDLQCKNVPCIFFFLLHIVFKICLNNRQNNQLLKWPCWSPSPTTNCCYVGLVWMLKQTTELQCFNFWGELSYEWLSYGCLYMLSWYKRNQLWGIFIFMLIFWLSFLTFQTWI